VQANGVSIEVEDSAPGDTRRPVVLLIMGLGMQLIAWSDELVGALHAAGFRVVRFDNRDAGLSQDMAELGVRTPNVLWFGARSKLGLPAHPPYTLEDMAHDALGVLDALGVEQAHVVGASMGGMIAQRVALAAPHRVLSLVSMISTSGAPTLPGPEPEVVRAFLRPATRAERQGDEQALVARAMGAFTLIGSPAYPFEHEALQASTRRAVQRSVRPQGTLRQLMAVVSDTTRFERLHEIRCPVLVLHGDADAMLPLACGEDTARRIPGARLVVLPGMGHMWPQSQYMQWGAQVLAFLQALTDRERMPEPAVPAGSAETS